MRLPYFGGLCGRLGPGAAALGGPGAWAVLLSCNIAGKAPRGCGAVKAPGTWCANCSGHSLGCVDPASPGAPWGPSWNPHPGPFLPEVGPVAHSHSTLLLGRPLTAGVLCCWSPLEACLHSLGWTLRHSETCKSRNRSGPMGELKLALFHLVVILKYLFMVVVSFLKTFIS